MKYIIANWKAHFTETEAKDWCVKFSEKLSNGNTVQAALSENKLRIIIAPPFPHISLVKSMLPNLKNIYVAAQDVSQYGEGSYTGDVTGKSLSGLVQYAIVGHSERRSLYHESAEDIAAKVQNLATNAIEPILCVRGISDPLHELAHYVAFEPVEAIGTGQNASLELVLQVKHAMNVSEPRMFIYGGSVDPDSCKEYLTNPDIDGVLVGSASLDPHAFYSIITQV